MLVVNTREFFHEEFTWKWSLIPRGERCFSSWPSTWPPWRHVQTSNKSFPISPGPLYQNEVKCSAFDMEIILILKQVKLIFTRKVMHLASFWKWRKWLTPESYLCPLPSSNLHFPPLPRPCSFLFVREKPWVSYHTYHQQFSITPLFNAYPSGQSPYKPTNWQRCLPSEAIRSCTR